MYMAMQNLLDRTRAIDFLAPLAIRLYLVPIFWSAGIKKYNGFENTVGWFDSSLGLPFPQVMAFLATSTELAGAVMLLVGLGVRWISIPLITTMIVAITSVHWQNGWSAIAEGSGFFATDRTAGAIERLDRANEILTKHGNYEWLSANGDFIVLNNGIEFAATYLIMLLVLFFYGAGKYVSADFWIAKKFSK